MSIIHSTKSFVNFRTIGVFLIECAIPILSTIFLPSFFPNASNITACIAAMCISIFIAIWDLKYILQNDSNELNQHSHTSKNQFASLSHRVDVIGQLIEFQKKVNNISHPYFQNIINEELSKELMQFEINHHELLDGYIETNPYSTSTFGIGGIRWTKKNF